MSEPADIPNEKRKLFFGLFVFPLIIAVGMAVLLCAAVLLTHEKETPESLIAALKKSAPSKRWQKAFELSNELNHATPAIRENGVLKEIILILRDAERYDTKTRGYMALALAHFHGPDAVNALRDSLKDEDENVRLFSLWALGALGAREAAPDLLPFIKSGSADSRKTAAYVLGAIGESSARAELTSLLSDPVQDVRWNAALALARLGDDAGLAVLTEMLERDRLSLRYHMEETQIEAVMTNAAKGLALIRRPEAFKILETVSRNDRSLKVRQAALNALQFYSEKPNS